MGLDPKFAGGVKGNGMGLDIADAVSIILYAHVAISALALTFNPLR